MKQIPTTRGQVILVDDDDYELMSSYRWTAGKSPNDHTFYAARSIKINGCWKHISFHRFLLNPPPGTKVDHIDGNGLNNCRSNLRLCTHAENLMNMRIHNKHGYKGVASSNKKHKPWIAKITFNGKMKTIGCFKELKEAAQAYNEAAKRLFGEFAKLNKL